MFTEAQKSVIERSLDQIEEQMGTEERDLLERISKSPVGHIDAHHLVGLLLELRKELSFQGRLDAIRDIQEELKTYARNCLTCNAPIKSLGGFCSKCNPSNQPSYRSFEVLKNGYGNK